MRVAGFYWPSLLVWTVGHPGPRTLRETARVASRNKPGSLTVPFDSASVVTLFPDHVPGVANQSDVHDWLAELVDHAQGLGHRDVRGIAGEGSVSVGLLPGRVERLQRLRRHLPHPYDEAPVLSARWFALDCLLSEGLNRSRALSFVEDCIGRLVTYDRDHGTELANVLELALDFPHRDDAARAAYMHRNTFRRHLKHALEIVSADLEDPDDRLALHVALRLGRLVDARDRSVGRELDAAQGSRGRQSVKIGA
jgi:hypothetical protein